MKNIFKIISILATIFFCFAISHTASALSLAWTQTYYTSSTDSTYGGAPGNIALDSSGNIYITGLYKTGTQGGIMTKKYNSSGGLLWSQSYIVGSSGSLHGRGIAISPTTGDVYVVSMATSTGYGHFRFVQYTSAGSFVRTWTYEQAFDQTEIPEGVVVDSSGNVYAVAEDRSCGARYCFAIVKFNGSGVFQQIWKSPFIDLLDVGNIDKDSSGNIYVFGEGQYYPSSTTPLSMYGLKYSNTGTLLQTFRFQKQQFGAATFARAFGKVDQFGNVYLSGEDRNGSPFEMDRSITKYSSAGTQLWNIRYSGWSSGSNYGMDIGLGLAVDSSGNVYSTGRSRNPINPTSTVYGMLNIKLTSSSGSYLDRLYQSSSSLSRTTDRGRDVIFDPVTGSVYVVSDDNLGVRLSKFGLNCNGPFSFGSWTDHPAVASGTTPIRAQHVTEIRQHINTLEVDAGLATTTWTDNPLSTSTGIKATHINQMRTALQNIYSACGQSAPSWTDSPTVTAGVTPVRAQHINELRTYVEQAK